MQQHYKISFCTVCMNRLYHLRETLPANLRDNASYPDLEFVLLDYNSSDGLESWIKNELTEFIESGRLVYYKTTEPQYFHRSHSRNMVFNLASADIVCNIDADNFTGKDFAHYINNQFTLNKNIFIAADTLNRYYFIRDVCGRICFWKTDFNATGGFDEQMEGYGDEDIDFINKLQKLGRQEVVILNGDHLRAIYHTDLERVQNEYAIANLQELYASHLTPYSSRILFLFRDNVFHRGTLIDKLVLQSGALPTTQITNTVLSPNDRYSLKEAVWESGTWHCQNSVFHFQLAGKEHGFRFQQEADRLIPLKGDSSDFFFRINEGNMIVEAINFYSRMKNVAKLNENKAQKLSTTQQLKVGKGRVVKNFNNNFSIYV